MIAQAAIGAGALDDAALRQKPADGVLTPPHMFVATLQAQLTNCRTGISNVITRLEAKDKVVALNCNYGHKCLPGHEKWLKLQPNPKRKRRRRPRKLQGDGTCFSSALEPVVVGRTKLYFMKCFTSTGETQVPGTLCPDLSDGLEVLHTWVDYLNEFGIGDLDDSNVPRKIEVAWAKANLFNFKFRVQSNSPRQIINLKGLADYLQALEDNAAELMAGEDDTKALPHWPLPGTRLVIPPHPVKEVKPPVEAVKISFRVAFPDHIVRVNIFGSGKVNILGANQFEMGAVVHKFVHDVFDANWQYLVRLKPRKDSEKKAAPKPRRVVEIPRPAPPVYTLTDAEFDALLDEICSDSDRGVLALAAQPNSRRGGIGKPKNEAAPRPQERKERPDKHFVDKILALADELENDLEKSFDGHVNNTPASQRGNSDGLVVDEMGEEDEANHQEDSLENDAP